MSTSSEKSAESVLRDPRWAAIVTRDPRMDGQFCYSVRTTGVYCRPSCGARTPNPENVRFFDTEAAAAQAGFRPCKRCRPDQPPLRERHAALVEQLCRQIENATTAPDLRTLAHSAQLSPFHLHRIFKAVTGLTPRAYAAAHRAQKLRDELIRSRRVTDAIYEAGFNSSGRFYEASKQLLGMTPKHFRAGGANVVMRFAVGECTLGSILVAASARGICAILLGDDPDALVRDLQDRFPRAELVGGDAGFEQQVAQVVGFVDMPRCGLDLPLDIRGTAFQQRVWQVLSAIPAGTTLSYTEVARRIGAPRAVRAVAQACAANPLAVAIPCHRVVRNDGGLSGYRWGVARKQALLDRESGP